MDYKRGSILQRKIYAIYNHMGIYDGRQVYHYQKSGKSISIVHTSLEAFATGKEVRVHCEPKDAVHAKAILKRAREAYKSKAWTNRYSLWLNNCEDFCASCYGEGMYRRLSQRGKTVVVMAVVAGMLMGLKKITKDDNKDLY